MIVPYAKPIAAIAVAALLGGVSWWSYSKGYDRAEDRYLAEKSAELEAQKRDLTRAHQRQLAALQTKARGEDEARTIGQIPRPDIALCDAGDGWLHATQDAVRAANRAAGVNGAAAPIGDSASF